MLFDAAAVASMMCVLYVRLMSYLQTSRPWILMLWMLLVNAHLTILYQRSYDNVLLHFHLHCFLLSRLPDLSVEWERPLSPKIAFKVNHPICKNADFDRFSLITSEP